MFTVTWTTPAGSAASGRFPTAAEAFRKAIENMALGFEDVTIGDDYGKTYTPADFHKIYRSLGP